MKHLLLILHLLCNPKFDLADKRYQLILQQQDLLLPLAQQEQQQDPYFFEEFQALLNDGSLFLSSEGTGAAYLLCDTTQTPRFVIKPSDESAFCLNNPKNHPSFFSLPAKEFVPLYHQAEREAASYELAQACHLDHITPKTILSTIHHPDFFLHEELDPDLPHPKICSLQEYIPHSSSLYSLLQHLLLQGMEEETLAACIDQEDFADAMLFVWITYDTDAHAQNFRLYQKSCDRLGLPVYGIKKIDNGLCFPEQNYGLSNILAQLPNAKKPISNKIKQTIRDFPSHLAAQILSKFFLLAALPALEERIDCLRKLVEIPDITYCAIDRELHLLEASIPAKQRELGQPGLDVWE